MLFNKKILAVSLLILAIASPVYAQVCREPGGGGSGIVNVDCDMRYRDTVVACDKKNAGDTLGTRPTCPKKPMPMIETPKRSYIADYSPYLYAYPRDEKDPSKPYAGPYGIGTSGDTTKTFQMMGKSPPGMKIISSCTNQLDIDTSSMSLADQAKAARMQIDNCTNQYILNTAIYPYQKENVKLLSMDDPTKPGQMANLAGECQPLRTFTETKNEYAASTYIEAAWKKLLQEPGYRKNTNNILPLLPVCLSFDPFGLPCKHEPQLPDGTTISNPIAPPSPFPEVLLSSISAIQYEEIVDPSHPFSPRWDFVLNDRQYSSPVTAAYTTNSLAIYALHYLYMSDTKNTIFCAGVKKADKEPDAKKKKDLEVPVDVLEFRRKPFEEALLRRTTYNAMCYNAPALWPSGTQALFIVAPFSYCYQITGFSFWYPWIYAKDQACWKCFGLNGKVDDEQSHPPCTTNYLGKDLKMVGSWFPGGFNLFRRDAQCNYPLQKKDDKYKMDLVCKDLRKPYTQINKLKMRYHNPDDKDDPNGDNVVLKDPGAITASGKKDGALEGMTFKEYFGNHMPYPKLWDTGTSLRRSSSANSSDQPETDVTGQYTAIVGIGRESAAKVAVNGMAAGDDGKTPEERYTDQRCKAGGWGGMAGDLARSTGAPWFSDLSGIGMSKVWLPDPVTSWTEMKLYQTRTLRNVGMSCLGRYEKVFKPGSAENMILLAAGAEWSKLTVTKCEKDTGGRTKNCKDMTLKEYADAGKPNSDNATVYIKQLQKEAWPNAWRGYMAGGPLGGTNLFDPNKFPNFGGNSGLGTDLGLDHAQLGDIIMLPFGAKNVPPVPFSNSAGLAKLAFVIETRLENNSDCDAKHDCYVKVLEPDNGKWPDSCGTTDTWGEMKTRYYYKPGHLPEPAIKEFDRIKSTKDCEDSRLGFCEQSSWSSLPIYRIRLDSRKGCQKKEKAANCDKDQ